MVREIRDMCVFSSHSVIRDPPFSRIDLISCRNLLIYLGGEFQSRVIPIFHFALRPGGYLFLGTSENISQYGELFQRIDKKQRLFQRRDHATARCCSRCSGRSARLRRLATDPPRCHLGGREPAADDREHAVLENFAPPHVVVNREGDVVHYSARTGRYLEAAAGVPTRQLCAPARRGLRLELRSAFQEALETRRTVVRERVAVEIDGPHAGHHGSLIEPHRTITRPIRCSSSCSPISALPQRPRTLPPGRALGDISDRRGRARAARHARAPAGHGRGI